MKIWVHAKEEVNDSQVDIQPSGKYEIIGQVSITLTLHLYRDNTVITDTAVDSYPGPKQFLADAEQVITNAGNTILYSENSNRPDSPSIYVVYECPVSADKALFCTIFVKITNHKNMISDYTKDTDDFRNNLGKMYTAPESLGFDKFDIFVEMEVRTGYQDALSAIQQELGAIKRSEIMRYKRSGDLG